MCPLRQSRGPRKFDVRAALSLCTLSPLLACTPLALSPTRIQTGLPIDPERVRKLCELEPFLSANELVVTPIVVLLLDPLIKVS